MKEIKSELDILIGEILGCSPIDEVSRVDEESQYKYIRKLIKGDIFHIEGIPCRYLGNENYGTGTDLDKLKN